MKSRINISISTIEDNGLDLRKALDLIVRDEVLVGVPEDRGKRKQGVATNALLAYVHDKGSPANNIPARPFMEPGILNASEKIGELMKRVGKAALSGNATGVYNGLVSVGLAAQSSIRARITEGIPPPLRPRTIAARRRRGRMSIKPLIDTGQLRNSINFELRRKK